MNDSDHVLLASRLGPTFWNGKAWSSVSLPAGCGCSAVGVDGRDGIFVSRSDGEVGVDRRGRIRWLNLKTFGPMCENDKGQVAGITGTVLDGRPLVVPFVFSGGSVKHLKAPTVGHYAQPVGMNNRGQIVGFQRVSDGPRYLNDDAVIWLRWDGRMIDLNSLVPIHSSWHLLTAVSINDHGEIVGWAERHGTLCGYEADILRTPMPNDTTLSESHHTARSS